VVEDAFIASAEAEWLGIRDEVDFMAHGGEFNAEFGGHNAGTAVGGIASDADTHEAFFDWNLVRRGLDVGGGAEDAGVVKTAKHLLDGNGLAIRQGGRWQFVVP